jgi:hypothetical protein
MHNIDNYPLFWLTKMAPIADPADDAGATAAAPAAPPPSLLTLLTSLPRDLLRTLLSQNCSGKTLSTLRLSLTAPLWGPTSSTVRHGQPNEEASLLSLLVELISSILEDRLSKFDYSSSASSSSLSLSPSFPSNEDKYLSQVQSCIRNCQWEEYASFVRFTSTTSQDENHSENEKSAASQPQQQQQLLQQHTPGRFPSFSWKIPALVDYLEQPDISHAVWCGRLEFPSFVFQSNTDVQWDHSVVASGGGGGVDETCHAKVILQAMPARWTTKALREWHAVTLAAASFASASTKSISASFDSSSSFSSSQKNSPQPTLLPLQDHNSTGKARKQPQPHSCFRLSRPQPYNFVPIPPYGRILAPDVPSQQVLASISEYLEQNNLVLTLPATSAMTIVTTTDMTCSGRRRTRQRRRTLIIRIISPRQAQCRMEERFGSSSSSSSFRPMDWDKLVSPPFTADATTSAAATSAAATEGLICSWEYDGEEEDEEKTNGACGDNDNEVSIQNDIKNGNLSMEAILEILRNYHYRNYYGATCKTAK